MQSPEQAQQQPVVLRERTTIGEAGGDAWELRGGGGVEGRYMGSLDTGNVWSLSEVVAPLVLALK